jgi:hypothetical protein
MKTKLLFLSLNIRVSLNLIICIFNKRISSLNTNFLVLRQLINILNLELLRVIHFSLILVCCKIILFYIGFLANEIEVILKFILILGDILLEINFILIIKIFTF